MKKQVTALPIENIHMLNLQQQEYVLNQLKVVG
jgi:hypothetical protein